MNLEVYLHSKAHKYLKNLDKRPYYRLRENHSTTLTIGFFVKADADAISKISLFGFRNRKGIMVTLERRRNPVPMR